MKQFLIIDNASQLTQGIPGLKKIEWTSGGPKAAWAPNI
jgi:hypothetical protein